MYSWWTDCRRRACVAVVLAALVQPAFARAQASPERASAAPAVGDGHFDVAAAYEKAMVAYAAKDYAASYAWFLRVWAVEKKPKTAANLGRTEVALGRYRDAAEHLSFFLREQKSLSQEDRAKAEALLGEARKHVGALGIDVRRAGAEVLVDGRSVGVSPLGHEIYADPGARKIEARLGASSVSKNVDVRAGEQVSVALAPAPSKPAAPPGAALSDTAAPPSSATVHSASPARVGLLAGGAALAVTGLGIGIGTGVASLVRQGEQDRCVTFGRTESEARSCWDNLEPERGTLARVSLAGLVAGGLFAAGTVVYGVVGAKAAPPIDKAPPVRVSFTGTGFVLSGSF